MVIDIDSLTVSQKILLAEDLWDSVLGLASESLISDSEKAVLDSELVDLEQHPDSGLNWDVVKAKIKNKLHG